MKQIFGSRFIMTKKFDRPERGVERKMGSVTVR
jgi:hypothetical protein